jgi:hypothetical protein
MTLDSCLLIPGKVSVDGRRRHSDIRTTMNICGEVLTDEMGQAHSKVVGLALRRPDLSDCAGDCRLATRLKEWLLR